MGMTDKDLIRKLGGPTKVAEMLSLDKSRGGVQRVSNWMSRGIPAAIKLAHPDIFLADLVGRRKRRGRK
jgi:hypothetical protein